MKTICLNMIVKNESCVIRRCLESVMGLIDFWVIVDTGSTDETKEIISECLKEIPGTLHERPWVDFSYNRNEAMELAQEGDYLLFLDADETLDVSEPLDKAALDKDLYLSKTRDLSVDLYRVLLIRQDPLWRWQGVLHETIEHPKEISCEILPHIQRIGVLRDGARAFDSKRYQKDAAILEEALQTDPTNTRYAFYLAQSYGSAGMRQEALAAYETRAQMGGSHDERFLSLYYSACLQEDLCAPFSEVVHHYERAARFDPSRAEPLASLARYLLNRNMSLPAYLLSKRALSLSYPTSLLYVRREVYDYQCLFFFACSAQLMGKQEEAQAAYRELLLKKELPDLVRERIFCNLLL